MEMIHSDYKNLQIQKGKMAGKKCVNHYFYDSMGFMRTKSGFTRDEWIQKHKDKPYVKRLVAYHTNTRGTPLDKALYYAFQLYSQSGCMSAQLPMAIVDCINQYHPDVVYDPCAGWGSRMLGACSQGCRYVGCDTNPRLQPVYAELIDELGLDAEVLLQDSANVDMSGYDMVYTSPPYWYVKDKRPVEQYEDMPSYKNREEFINEFFLAMFERCWNGLNPGGVLCLNIPPCMYEHLPPCDEVRELITRNKRRSKNRDMVYIWKKTERLTIQPSTVHGNGVFAMENIPKNTRLYDYTGDKLKWSDFKEKYGKDYRYCYMMPRIQTIIVAKERPYRSYNYTNYINERYIPNVCLKKHGLYTLEDIDINEELFLRYGKNYPRDYTL